MYKNKYTPNPLKSLKRGITQHPKSLRSKVRNGPKSNTAADAILNSENENAQDCTSSNKAKKTLLSILNTFS